MSESSFEVVEKTGGALKTEGQRGGRGGRGCPIRGGRGAAIGGAVFKSLQIGRRDVDGNPIEPANIRENRQLTGKRREDAKPMDRSYSAGSL